VPLTVAGIGAIEDAKVTLTVPVKAPTAAGVKLTLMTQFPPAGIDPQALVWEKSAALAPLMVTVDTCTLNDPMFERIRLCEALVVPTVWLLKLKLAGEKLATVPVPVSATVCGLPAALSVTEIVPVTTPFATGVNVTEIVQLAPTPRVAEQVLVSAK
jgi:hypothetical protein